MEAESGVGVRCSTLTLVLSLTSLAENAGLLTFLNRFDRLPVRGTIQRKIFCNCQFRLHSYDTQSPLVGIAMVNVVDV
jgi:hypothetical protein